MAFSFSRTLLPSRAGLTVLCLYQHVNSFMCAGMRPLAPSHVGAWDVLSQFVYPTTLGWWRVKYLVDQGSCSQVPDQPVWYSGSRPLGITWPFFRLGALFGDKRIHVMWWVLYGELVLEPASAPRCNASLPHACFTRKKCRACRAGSHKVFCKSFQFLGRYNFLGLLRGIWIHYNLFISYLCSVNRNNVVLWTEKIIYYIIAHRIKSGNGDWGALP